MTFRQSFIGWRELIGLLQQGPLYLTLREPDGIARIPNTLLLFADVATRCFR